MDAANEKAGQTAQPEQTGTTEPNERSPEPAVTAAPAGATPPPRPAAPAPEPEPPKKHAGLGIASFVIAVVALVLVIIGIIGLAALNPDVIFAAMSQQLSDEELTVMLMKNAPMFLIGAMLILFASFLTFIGGVLGIAGLFMPKRKRLFAILGTALNGVMVLFALLIGLLGFLGASML